jgi:hypothetical protein
MPLDNQKVISGLATIEEHLTRIGQVLQTIELQKPRYLRNSLVGNAISNARRLE